MTDEDRGKIPWTAIATILAAVISVGGGTYLANQDDGGGGVGVRDAAILVPGSTGTTISATTAPRVTFPPQRPVVELAPLSFSRSALARQLALFVRVSGTGWYTDNYVTVTFGNMIRRQDAPVRSGSFSTLFALPTTLQPAPYIVRVDGLQSGRYTTRTFNLYV